MTENDLGAELRLKLLPEASVGNANPFFCHRLRHCVDSNLPHPSKQGSTSKSAKAIIGFPAFSTFCHLGANSDLWPPFGPVSDGIFEHTGAAVRRIKKNKKGCIV